MANGLMALWLCGLKSLPSEGFNMGGGGGGGGGWGC